MELKSLTVEDTSEKMTVEIWSDVTCPYCYTAKRKWERALSEFRHRDQIEVIWRSFELAPGLKTDPSQRMPPFFAKLNRISLEEAQRLCGEMEKTARRVGLEYHYDRIVPANSFQAHRLSHFAKERGLQEAAEERLFRAYFTEGRNIDDFSTLVSLGQDIGLDEADISTVLKGDRYREEVRQDLQEAQKLGIRGVPYFLFNQTAAISGERDSAEFLTVLNGAFAEWAGEGRACRIGEVCL